VCVRVWSVCLSVCLSVSVCVCDSVCVWTQEKLFISVFCKDKARSTGVGRQKVLVL
jgi:hypothetical protein